MQKRWHNHIILDDSGYKRIHVRSSFYDIVARLEMESILQLNSDMHVPYLVSIFPGAVLFGLLSDREVESEEDGERRGVTRTRRSD